MKSIVSTIKSAHKKAAALFLAALIAVFAPAFACANVAPGAARNAVTITCCGMQFSYYDDIVPAVNHVVAEEFFRNKVNAAPETKAEYVAALTEAGYSRKKAMLAAYPALGGFFDKINAAVSRKAEDSSIKFLAEDKPRFSISREKPGRTADEKDFYNKLFLLWQHNLSGRITLDVKAVAPSVTAAENQKRILLRSEFFTDYSSSGANRSSNIELAMRALNGTRLKCGGQFSFNAAVGPRTEKRGYKQAKIIVGGKYVDGIGGGVCQVSTTLYNAALEAGLCIDEASGHTLASSYIQPSFDATVNSGTVDLKFTNCTEGEIFISAVCDGKKAVIKIFGTENPYEIRRRYVITRRGSVPEDEIILDTEGRYFTDESESGELVRIKNGLAGFESEGYLDYYQNGKKVFSRRIRRDKYASIRGILAKKP